MTARTLSTLVVLFLTLGAPPSKAAELQYGPLSIQWIDGFFPKDGGGPIALSGPDGEELLISIYPLASKLSAAEADTRVQELQTFAETKLRNLAEQAGEVTVPLQRELLPTGTTLFSTGSKTRNFLFPRYFLQFLLVSPGGQLALLTVEGRGNNAQTEYGKYRPLFDSVRWIQ